MKYSLSSLIKPVRPKGNQSWIFIGKADAEAVAPVTRTPDTKSWFIGKDPDASKYWGQEEAFSQACWPYAEHRDRNLILSFQRIQGFKFKFYLFISFQKNLQRCIYACQVGVAGF